MRGGITITEKDVHDINPANLMIFGLIRMFDDPDHMLHGRFNNSDDQNQVEIWFSILQRRVLKYGSFSSRDLLGREVEGFIDHWNACEARPFRWTWRGNRLDNRVRLAA